MQILINDRASADDRDWSLGVINNWRASHGFPLNTMQMYLRTQAKAVDSRSLLAQRIKRLPAIDDKLRRMGRLTLSEMQDVGGARAVVRTVGNVNRLTRMYDRSRIKHQLDHIDDYIKTPRATGYRGVHLIYRYHSDRTETYEGLKIELQLRTRLQHAWATAVETVGLFRQQMLKANRGDRDWLRFFALMGMAIALRERTAPVPSTPANEVDLANELREWSARLDVEGHLSAYRTALRIVRHPSLTGAEYFLLNLDPVARRISITGYRARDLDRASREYLSAERATLDEIGPDAVLVRVDSAKALRRAYPNYFLDTRTFLNEVKRATESP